MVPNASTAPCQQAAKGLEWQAVYVLHASDGLIPPVRSFDDLDAMEEERRIFYVALTRAADWLYVCHTQFHYQGGHGGWSDWDDDGSRELTRFLVPRAQQAFDQQSASQFRPPESVVTRQRKSPSSRQPARQKKKARRARRG
jgi:DNA helicase-2/ATP-dependent DNA helicase PcrA